MIAMKLNSESQVIKKWWASSQNEKVFDEMEWNGLLRRSVDPDTMHPLLFPRAAKNQAVFVISLNICILIPVSAKLQISLLA